LQSTVLTALREGGVPTEATVVFGHTGHPG